MGKKDQHYVPRVYLKSWLGTVYSNHEPSKPFEGIYVFSKDNLSQGNGITREKVLFNKHTYTVDSKHLFISNSCPLIAQDYAKSIHDAIIARDADIVLNGERFSETEKIAKHLQEIDDFGFICRSSGRELSPKAIINQIKDIRSYVIEDAFANLVENKWEGILKGFIVGVTSSLIIGPSSDIRIISPTIVGNMVDMFILMACRNPQFDCMGIFPAMKEIFFDSLIRSEPPNTEFSKVLVDMSSEMMRGLWLREVYRALFHVPGGWFLQLRDLILNSCQIILFHIHNSHSDGCFITTDNPAFMYVNNVVKENRNGFYFPLTPEFIIGIFKSNDNISGVSYRIAKAPDIKVLNQIVRSSSTQELVANRRTLNNII